MLSTLSRSALAAACLASPAAAQDKPTTAPTAAAPHFTDVLADSGITFRHHFIDSENGSTYRINPYDHGSGVFVADVNGDALEDVLFLDFLGTNGLYLNRGGMKFEDVSAKSGIGVDRAIKVSAAFGDCDGDGDLDLYVTTYRGGNHLFANRGDGTFEDITAKAGVGYRGHSCGVTWFDYDLDGDLDLYLCNMGKFTTDTISKEADFFYTGVSLPFLEVAKTPDARTPGEGSILYRNEGGNKFTDVTKLAGVAAAEWNADAAVSDIDLDGDPDLYVSNMFGPNHLYRNRGDGTFEDVTDAALVRTSWGGMGARFFDANGDATPDLYVVDMHSDMWLPIDKPEEVRAGTKYATPIGKMVSSTSQPIASAGETRAKSVLFGNTFFRNRGDGTFVEQSAEAGLENWWPWGIAAGDFNNDGAEDLFVPAGMGYPFYYWQNQFLLNDGSGRFTECAKAAGIEPPAAGIEIKGAAIKRAAFVRSSRASAVADFDRDGDVDLVVANFNHEPYLFRNDSAPGHALRLRLRNKAKAPAFGARVVVTAGGRAWSRELLNAQGYMTQSSAIVHVGLGAVDHVDQVAIFWPGAKTAQVVAAPTLHQVVDVVQE